MIELNNDVQAAVLDDKVSRKVLLHQNPNGCRWQANSFNSGIEGQQPDCTPL